MRALGSMLMNWWVYFVFDRVRGGSGGRSGSGGGGGGGGGSF